MSWIKQHSMTLCLRKRLTLLKYLFAALVIVASITCIIRMTRHQPNHLSGQPLGHQRVLDQDDRAAIFGQRREHVQHVCQRHRTSYNVTDDVSRYFSFSPRHGLVYCSIQKVGCSFWLRMMKVLRGELGPEAFFNGSFRHQTGEKGPFGFWQKPAWYQKRILKSYAKFLFVRDPYSRLFSAYMDKVFLPTSRVLKVLRATPDDVNPSMLAPPSAHLRGGRREHGRVNVLTYSKAQCITNVSFRTFLEALVSGRLSDGHFSPMYQHCDPCNVDFEFIGRMESFMSDTEFLLNQTGISLADMSRPERSQLDSEGAPHYLVAHDLQSEPGRLRHFDSGTDSAFRIKTDLIFIADLVEDMFRPLSHKGHCHSSYFCEIFTRAWTTLQTRGLISANVTLNSLPYDCKSVRRSDFIDRLTQAYFQSTMNREERARQREAAMLEAFYSLPRDLLQKVEKYVQKDCELFGYECSVDSRFPVRGRKGAKLIQQHSFFSHFTTTKRNL